MTYAMINGQAGIIGGGIASGLRNEAEPQGGSHVNTVNITIAGNTVVGADDDNSARIFMAEALRLKAHCLQ